LRTGQDDDGFGAGSSDRSAGSLAIEIRPATIEDLSTIRYIHDNAFKRDARAYFSEAEIAQFSRYVYTPTYADKLIVDNLQVATIDRDLVATAAWAGVTDGRTTARIKHVFVRPLFTGLGIGHRIVEAMEQQAVRAGYDAVTLRATLNTVGFFESRGYVVSSYGVRNLIADASLAVAFMRKSTVRGGSH
jgi:GNAT superfamily N-acetyltransferase